MLAKDFLFEQGETGAELKKRVMEKGIDISDKPSLLNLCCKKMKMSEEEVVSLFKSAKATKEQTEILLTKKILDNDFCQSNLRQRLSLFQMTILALGNLELLVLEKWPDVSRLMILLNF